VWCPQDARTQAALERMILPWTHLIHSNNAPSCRSSGRSIMANFLRLSNVKAYYISNSANSNTFSSRCLYRHTLLRGPKSMHFLCFNMWKRMPELVWPQSCLSKVMANFFKWWCGGKYGHPLAYWHGPCLCSKLSDWMLPGS
jgi:hypothetical protein